MIDDVVLLVITFHPDDLSHVTLYVVPGFARQPLWGDDAEVLATTRLFLTLKPNMEHLFLEPFSRVKRLEAAGGTCYMGLPKRLCTLDFLDPVALYTMLCLSLFSEELGVSTTALCRFLWNVVVPDACPRCDGIDTWALRSPALAVCHVCGNAVPTL